MARLRPDGEVNRPPRDEEREDRIANEVVVDAYGSAERAIGWYTYLEDRVQFPFRARCVAERAISFLRPGDKVEVTGMAPVDVCEREIFVMTRWKDRTSAVPLSQVAGIGVDDLTEQAIADWHYWFDSGYTF